MLWNLRLRWRFKEISAKEGAQPPHFNPAYAKAKLFTLFHLQILSCYGSRGCMARFREVVDPYPLNPMLRGERKIQQTMTTLACDLWLFATEIKSIHCMQRLCDWVKGCSISVSYIYIYIYLIFILSSVIFVWLDRMLKKFEVGIMCLWLRFAFVSSCRTHLL